MKIVITMDVDDSWADPAHAMGVTEAGYEAIMDALAELGGDIDVKRAEE